MSNYFRRVINVSLIYVQPKGRTVTYVYESRSHWDPDKKQSRATRHLVGKLDPKTGKIVKTGTRGRKKSRRKKVEVTVSEKKPNYKSSTKRQSRQSLPRLTRSTNCSNRSASLRCKSKSTKEPMSEFKTSLIEFETS